MPKKIIIIFFIIIALILGLVNLAWAQNPLGYPINPNPEQCQANPNMPGCPANPNPPKDRETKEAKLDNPIGETSIATIIGKIIKAFLGIIGTISLVMFIYGGITLLTSAGAPAKIKTGQQTLVWASLGILVVFASYAVLKFIFSAFGFV